MSQGFDLLAFAGVMVLGQFSPGPDMLLLTRTALRDGALAGVKMGLGIATGLIFHSVLAFAGQAFLFQRFAWFETSLRWMAAAWLLWMSYQILRNLNRPIKDDSLAGLTSGSPFTRGLACNLLNPKAAVFLAAVGAPFLRGDNPAWWPVALGGIVVVQAGVLWSLWAWFLQWTPLGISYRKLERWIDGVFAAVLVALAVSLLLG